MVEYDSEWIKKKFKGVAASRIRQKERGDSRYAGDAGYWEGGRCNWGANHNLDEDCHTLAEAFRKINELKDPKRQMLECSSREEFNTVKDRLLSRAKEAEEGLNPSIGAHSSMFGICIIWGDFQTHLEKQTRDFRRKISEIKMSIEGENYQGVVELKRLKFEEQQIKQRMEENKRKAQNEKDPAKKAILIQLIEEDGRKLKANIEKQKQLPISNLSFDPDGYIQGLLKALEESVGGSGGGSGGSGGSGGNRRNPTNPNDPFGDPNNWIDPTPSNNSIPRTPRNREPNQPQNNQQLILIVVAVVVVIYFIMPKEPSPKYANDYDY